MKGPKGLMPNQKIGNLVTDEKLSKQGRAFSSLSSHSQMLPSFYLIVSSIKDAKMGQVSFRYLTS